MGGTAPSSGSEPIGGLQPLRTDVNDIGKCNISTLTDLFAPDPTVIQELNEGDQLVVKLIKQGQTESVAVSTPEGQIAGSIGGASFLVTLIGCLEQNYTYKAVVDTISDSKVTVIVKRVQQ